MKNYRLMLALVVGLSVGCSSKADPWPGTYVGSYTETDTPCGGSAQTTAPQSHEWTIQRTASGLCILGMCQICLSEQSDSFATIIPGSCDFSASGTVVHGQWTGGSVTLNGAHMHETLVMHVTNAAGVCIDVAGTIDADRI